MKLYRQVDNQVELCILPKMEMEVRKLFDKEITEGYTEVLADGRIYFRFEISAEKATLLHWVSRWVDNENRSDTEVAQKHQRNAS